jgi:hypothetical protein
MQLTQSHDHAHCIEKKYPQWRWWPECMYTVCTLHIPNLLGKKLESVMQAREKKCNLMKTLHFNV